MKKPRGHAASKQLRLARRRLDQSSKLPERRACPTPGKKVYAGRKEAKSALKKVKGAGQPDRDLHEYRCQCGRWHLGTIPWGLARGAVDREFVNAPRAVPETP